jgi:hypothetical protein
VAASRGCHGTRWTSCTRSPTWVSRSGRRSRGRAPTEPPIVTRLLEIGSTSAEGKRLSAELRLLNRTARGRPVAGPIDVYHSLRQALVPRDRLEAGARVVTIHDMIPFLFPELTEDRFIEGWYNPRRRHSSLDYLSPIAYEKRERLLV